MASTNTEKPTGKAEQKNKAVPAKAKKAKVENKIPVKNEEIKKVEEKIEEKKEDETLEKQEEKKPEKKNEVKKVKKSEVCVDASNLQVSTKYAVAICRFINHKMVNTAIKELEEVIQLKRPIPMKGEIPHRKGKIMSGRFPTRASKTFIILLKSLQSNAIQHDLENPIISFAIANKGTTVYGGRGRIQRKRTNIKIVAKQKKQKENKK